jgi:hypothetical protein
MCQQHIPKDEDQVELQAIIWQMQSGMQMYTHTCYPTPGYTRLAACTYLKTLSFAVSS